MSESYKILLVDDEKVFPEASKNTDSDVTVVET